jgi:RNA polymerase sigma-B factor
MFGKRGGLLKQPPFLSLIARGQFDLTRGVIGYDALYLMFLNGQSGGRAVDPEEARALAWFITGLRREAIRLAKKYRQLDERELLILDEPMVDQDLSEKLSMLDTIAAAVDVAAEAEGSVLVQDALSLLTQLRRAVITATVLEGATEGEGAARLGMSQQAIHRVKERALSRLRKYFVLDKPVGK